MLSDWAFSSSLRLSLEQSDSDNLDMAFGRIEKSGEEEHKDNGKLGEFFPMQINP